MSPEERVRQQCLQALKRIAWRLQYKQRMQNTRELLIFDERYENHPADGSDTDVVSRLYVQDLLAQIPSPKGQYILRRLLLDGCTEQEVASELQMSQQAVNKWRKKSLDLLRRHTIRSSLC